MTNSRDSQPDRTTRGESSKRTTRRVYDRPQLAKAALLAELAAEDSKMSVT